MAVTSKDILKSWFVTLSKPLQDQFWCWLDSYRHVNDKITSDDLSDDLKATINNAAIQAIVTAPGAASIVIPADTLIDMVVVYDASNPVFSAGTAAGLKDIIADIQLTNGKATIANVILEDADYTIYFNNTTPNTVIKLLKR